MAISETRLVEFEQKIEAKLDGLSNIVLDQNRQIRADMPSISGSDALNASVGELSSKIDALEASIQAIQNEITSLSGEISSLGSQISGEISDLSTEVSGLSSEIS